MNYIKFLLSDTFNVPNGVPGPSDFTVLISRVTNILLFVAGAVAVIFIIVGGIQYSTSGGSEDKTRTAKSTITNAVIGLIVTILAFVIVNFVISVFK
ncbi:MAG: pilin [Candidatus Saccharibacteria bacterium]